MTRGSGDQAIALGVAYVGSGYRGWQRQADEPTVQADLEQALSSVADAPISVTAAGRTDAGVHAMGQVVGFRSPTRRPLQAWVRGVNANVNGALRVTWSREVDAGFDARRSAVWRRYQYLLTVDPDGDSRRPHRRDPIWQRQTVSVAPVDVDAMHGAARLLIGEHDFSSFRASGCQSTTPYRHVHAARVRRCGDIVVVDLTANAFLLHMVRNIVAALLAVGYGRRSMQWIADLLAARDRRLTPATAPPDGLYLLSVGYPGYDFPEADAPPVLRAVGGLDRV